MWSGWKGKGQKERGVDNNAKLAAQNGQQATPPFFQKKKKKYTSKTNACAFAYLERLKDSGESILDGKRMRSAGLKVVVLEQCLAATPRTKGGGWTVDLNVIGSVGIGKDAERLCDKGNL